MLPNNKFNLASTYLAGWVNKGHGIILERSLGVGGGWLVVRETVYSHFMSIQN